MKKLLVIPILIICIVFLGGCNNEGKDAITARCDEFITMYEGTEHNDYRIDNIEYKLLSVNKGNPDYIVEIVWYFDVSGNYDMMSVLKEWTDITLDALNDIEISTHTFDVIYYKDSLNDALTVVVNGEAAYSGADSDGTATVVAHVSDITCDEEAICELVELCNRLELSPIHLYDVVEDFLAS
jgi:hypothetical protein